MTRTIARRRTFGAAAAVTALLLILSACGGAAEGGGGSKPADEEAQALAFAECMRDNGVDMPDPAPGQEGLQEAFQHEDVQDEDRATIDKARAACEDLLPQFSHDAGHDQQREEMMLELAECLREQGFDVPDNLDESAVHDDVPDDELWPRMRSAATRWREAAIDEMSTVEYAHTVRRSRTVPGPPKRCSTRIVKERIAT